MKNIRRSFIAVLFILFSSTNLFAAFDYYWVGDSTQNGHGHWDSLSNWVHVAIGGQPVGGATPAILPGPDDNLYIIDTTGIQLNGRNIEIWAEEFEVNSLTVDVDSLSFYFDEGRISGDINFDSTGNCVYVLSPYNESVSNLISYHTFTTKI